MLEKFYPKEWVESTYTINWEGLWEQNIRGAVFDVDNTLVRHDEPADACAVAFFKSLHAMGMKTCLLSNNKEPRVSAFAAQVDSPYISKSGKPAVRNYNKAMEIMGTSQETTVFVGDQVFTDIYGANRAGIYSILVKPIDPKEEIQIVAKRYLEAVVLYFYKKSQVRENSND